MDLRGYDLLCSDIAGLWYCTFELHSWQATWRYLVPWSFASLGAFHLSRLPVLNFLDDLTSRSLASLDGYRDGPRGFMKTTASRRKLHGNIICPGISRRSALFPTFPSSDTHFARRPCIPVSRLTRYHDGSQGFMKQLRLPRIPVTPGDLKG